jgi:hypothetical protein
MLLEARMTPPSGSCRAAHGKRHASRGVGHASIANCRAGRACPRRAVNILCTYFFLLDYKSPQPYIGQRDIRSPADAQRSGSEMHDEMKGNCHG